MIDNYFEDFKQKLEKIETKLDSLEVSKEPIILTTTDVMRILGINRATANKLFKEDDFPKISHIKSNKIEQKAFTDWLRREKANKNN